MTAAAPGGSVDALSLRDVNKRFGSLVALDSVDLAVRPGSVHALVGENGAGKSTLMRIASGLLSADSGSITLFGRALGTHSVRDAARAGLGMVHQHLSLVPNLSVVENVALGERGAFRESEWRARLLRASEDAGIPVTADAMVRDLSLVEQQRVEILKALIRGARLLILDEPTAVLAPSEADDLLRWVRAFADRGGSVALVTHKLRDVLSTADDVTVLRRGRRVAVGAAATFSERALASAIFGEGEAAENATSQAIPTIPSHSAPVLVACHHVTIPGERGAVRVHDASFDARGGEIVGIAAVEGSGHRELLEALAGLRPPASGELRLPERIAIIPSDRGRDALIPEFTLTENVALHRLGIRRGFMPWRQLSVATAAIMERFSVAAPSEKALGRELSGGNQQRLVVGRELDQPADLVVADNPTRGLNLRASAFVHASLRDAARRGSLVVLHSSDIDEVLALATRVLVVFHGAVREVPADRGEVGRAMLGAA